MERDYSFLDHAERGVFFPKKRYQDEHLFSFEDVQGKLPAPVLDARPLWIESYWYTIKALFRHSYRPSKESGFVSNFVDAAFNADIFMWDTCFMSLFCNLLHPYVPGIQSLDNFYVKQFDDGEIPREIVRETGKDFLFWVNAYDKPLYSYFHKAYGFRSLSQNKDLRYEDMYHPDLGHEVTPNPYLTLDNLNHPIMAMAEWESYQQTGDIERLSQVLEPLYHYYLAMRKYLRHVSGLYVTDWASMDNSVRNKYLGFGVDITSEMVLFADDLIRIIHELSRHGFSVPEQEKRLSMLSAQREETADCVRKYMWDEEKRFFFDVKPTLERAPVKTAAAFWTMIAGIADKDQMQALTDQLRNPNTFCRLHRVPSLAADEPGFDPIGDYWNGSVWAPINAMILLGLEQNGEHELAREIALNDLTATNEVFRTTGTIWENYPADEISKGHSDHPEMVGWSGMAPIRYLIEYAVGLSVHEGVLCWDLRDEFLEGGKVGCKNYWFHDTTVDVQARREGQNTIAVLLSDRACKVKIHYHGADTAVELAAGEQKSVKLP